VQLIWQNVDLETINIEKTIKQLIEKGCISKDAAEMLDQSAIKKFFDSPTGQLLLDKKNTVMREWPFTYAVLAAELYPNAKNIGDDKIILQGIIDVLVKTPAGLIVIDFKTDRITPLQVQQRAAHYTPQLKWYCKAAGEILGEKKTTGVLYFLAAGQAIDI
jgi:ATP-dependent helicase/nuclease subunit A